MRTCAELQFKRCNYIMKTMQKQTDPTRDALKERFIVHHCYDIEISPSQLKALSTELPNVFNGWTLRLFSFFPASRLLMVNMNRNNTSFQVKIEGRNLTLSASFNNITEETSPLVYYPNRPFRTIGYSLLNAVCFEILQALHTFLNGDYEKDTSQCNDKKIPFRAIFIKHIIGNNVP